LTCLTSAGLPAFRLAVYDRDVLAPFDHLAAFGLRVRGYRSRYLDTPQGRIHVFEKRRPGKHPPLLVLHGLSSQGSHHLPLLRRLHGFGRVILPDFPGHGRSEHPEAGMEHELLRQSMLAIVDQVVDEPCVVYGTSLGGLAGLRLAAERPELVRALIVASPAGAPMEAEQLKRFLARFRIEDAEAALEFIDRLFHKRPPLARLWASGVQRAFASHGVTDLLARVVPGDMLSDDELARVSAPLTVIWGQSDRILLDEHRHWFRERLPHARWVEPRRAGHAPFVDMPRMVASVLHEAVAQL